MTTPATSQDSNQAGNPVPPAATHPADHFTEWLQLFWAKNSAAVLTGCTLVLLGILAKGGWEIYVEHRETSVGKAYAQAATTEQVKQFITAHSGHPLAGVAYLRLADEDYAAGKYAEAGANYEKSIAPLGELPIAARARLGAAMSQLLAGKAAEGEAGLRKIVDDAALFKSLRAEAAYHLVSQAVGAGKAAEVNTLVEKLLQIDGTSMWAQRAMMLRAQMPAAAAAAASPAPAAAPAAPAAGSGDLKVSLPGKK